MFALRSATLRATFMILSVFALGWASAARAAIVTQTIEYTDHGTQLEGYVAYDDAVQEARPGILVIHQWMGLGEYEQMRCRMLAEMGYVAFAADVYGKGVRPTSQQEAAAEAGKYYSDRELLRQRVGAGLDVLTHQKDRLMGAGGRALATVDTSKIAAIGYCFGGGAVIELARSGREIAGVVSFHGSLDTPNPEDAKKVRCPLLVLHGADDPYVGVDKVEGFIDEMRSAGVDYQLVVYGGAVHAFTMRGAGNDNSTGAAYHAKADTRSWLAMEDFYGEIFGRR